MYRYSLLLAVLTLCPMLPAESSRKSTAPAYTAASVVNSATNLADALAPNAIATIYGTDLCYGTSQASSANIVNRMLPSVLAGVRVYVGGYPASLYYVSPRQINFLIPEVRPGDMDFFIAREGTAGPHVRITVRDVGPGLYQWEQGMIASTHADGSVLGPASPAKPGEVIILYGTGFGPADPPLPNGQLPGAPAVLVNPVTLRMGGVTVRPSFAGLSAAGLYQINAQVPVSAPNGDVPVIATIRGISSPSSAVIFVQR